MRRRGRRWCQSYQGVEGGHGEDSQASQHALGGPAGYREEALGVGEFAALQAGLIAAQSEQVQVQFLQVLLPLLDLDTMKGRYTLHTLTSTSGLFGGW